MNKKLKLILTVASLIATFIGIVSGVIAIHDWATKEEFTIEQTVDPETMKKLRELGPGESVPVMKGRPPGEEDNDTNR